MIDNVVRDSRSQNLGKISLGVVYSVGSILSPIIGGTFIKQVQIINAILLCHIGNGIWSKGSLTGDPIWAYEKNVGIRASGLHCMNQKVQSPLKGIGTNIGVLPNRHPVASIIALYLDDNDTRVRINGFIALYIRVKGLAGKVRDCRTREIPRFTASWRPRSAFTSSG